MAGNIRIQVSQLYILYNSNFLRFNHYQEERVKKITELINQQKEYEKEQEIEVLEAMKTFNSKKMDKEQIEKSAQRLYDDAKRQKLKLESKRQQRMTEDGYQDNNPTNFEDMLRATERTNNEKEKEKERDLSASNFRKKKKTPKYNFIVN